MSRGLVTARPFAKKRPHHSLKRIVSKAGIPLPNISLSISQKAREILSWSVIGAILLVCGFFFLIKGVFFRPEFQIEQVKFSQATEETFYDIELFNAVSTAIKGKNFYVLQYFQKEHILKQIQRQFPFVIDMQFQMEAKPIITGEEVAISQDETVVGTGSETIETDGSVQIDTGGKVESLAVLAALEPIKGGILGVDLKFKDPVLKVKLGGKEFGIWDEEHFLEIKEGLLFGTETFVVDTPQYLTGTISLSGLFYEIPLETFMTIVPLIHKEIPNIVRFVYLAGSARLALFTDNGQVLYLNITTSDALQEQFEKYHTLRERYQNFEKLQMIDLGSLDASKVIVK